MRAANLTSVHVRHLERLNNSVNGNPRYKVYFEEDPLHGYVTSSDAGFCYGINNPEMRGAVDVWLTRAGRIEHMQPSEPQQRTPTDTAALNAIAQEQGWSDATIIGLLLDYIGNQQDDAAFENFLRDRQAEENAAAETLSWPDTSES